MDEYKSFAIRYSFLFFLSEEESYNSYTWKDYVLNVRMIGLKNLYNE